MTAIGFVGLGAMGSRMAARLLRGNQLYGTNRTMSRASELTGRGMTWRGTPRQVAAAAAAIFSMVTDDTALEAVTAGPDGILAGLRPGKIYVDMSTVSPQASRELAQRVHDAGASMLDAPVSGSITAAEDGTLAIMAGAHRMPSMPSSRRRRSPMECWRGGKNWATCGGTSPPSSRSWRGRPPHPARQPGGAGPPC
jgi:3-hydroxyisobutyrate dehydrogenase-like beta-hydroxyacid dehydrogenase